MALMPSGWCPPIGPWEHPPLLLLLFFFSPAHQEGEDLREPPPLAAEAASPDAGPKAKGQGGGGHLCHHLPRMWKMPNYTWPTHNWPRWPIVKAAVVEEEEMDPSPPDSTGPALHVSPPPPPPRRVLLGAPPSPFLERVKMLNMQLKSQLSRWPR